jgi:Arm DNA-binding domain
MATRELILQVLPSGRKLWTVRYRHRGCSGGSYSASIQRSLSPRRVTPCEDARAEIRNGGDPAGERQAAREVPTDTAAALVKEHVAKHVRIKMRGSTEEERALNGDVVKSERGDKPPAVPADHDLAGPLPRVHEDRAAPPQDPQDAHW